ncbi:gametogenetin-like [Panicum virgatum]|uniref:gametogenetin-like n=1 Tax=Panicum virgatum TaxID=38727 RepID=UPI0019D542D2|nr:gametogenetin-like [Panicum virgatum]
MATSSKVAVVIMVVQLVVLAVAAAATPPLDKVAMSPVDSRDLPSRLGVRRLLQGCVAPNPSQPTATLLPPPVRLPAATLLPFPLLLTPPACHALPPQPPWLRPVLLLPPPASDRPSVRQIRRHLLHLRPSDPVSRRAPPTAGPGASSTPAKLLPTSALRAPPRSTPAPGSTTAARRPPTRAGAPVVGIPSSATAQVLLRRAAGARAAGLHARHPSSVSSKSALALASVAHRFLARGTGHTRWPPSTSVDAAPFRIRSSPRRRQVQKHIDSGASKQHFWDFVAAEFCSGPLPYPPGLAVLRHRARRHRPPHQDGYMASVQKQMLEHISSLFCLINLSCTVEKQMFCLTKTSSFCQFQDSVPFLFSF